MSPLCLGCLCCCCALKSSVVGWTAGTQRLLLLSVDYFDAVQQCLLAVPAVAVSCAALLELHGEISDVECRC